ncbi:uncharacterized protein LOC115662860 isoform X1 [Syzygium oleosum]|uniref:uncharacterized protein LOC115662860 isoform X1 n=2 Tax=Syzygium oleosum TaxID=219896 RepID=UPI0011D224A7|nr:uncharacterized protein LOC115662860 isoform X1 [Syzygium oleosum]XP_056171404.1 uncharacterized protein LOC115662860 isoform X1 [Syzygium oleosum]
MEDTRLNFNQPFLTVRRFSPTVNSAEGQDKRRTDKSLPTIPPLPRYKSELKSGPVRNPGTVPFVWEQCPGRPKNESLSRSQTPECPPAAPKPPPGRIARVKQQDSEKTSNGVRSVRTQTRNIVLNSENAHSNDEGAKKKETTEEKGFAGSDYGDEAYLDALDTFSRSESFFLNCSVSGLSGVDGLDMRLSGRFSRDPPARDFMMGRFLPAAKAMASEAPLHFIRKQSVAQDLPRHPVKKAVVGGENRQLEVLKPNVLPMTHVGVREESEVDDYYESETSTTKICGLFPRFCLLNPVPGMRMQTVGLTVHKTQLNSTYARYQGESRSKHNKNAFDEQRSVGGRLKAELHENKCDLKSTQSQTTRKNDDKKLEGSSLYRRLQGNGKIKHQNGFSKSVTQGEERSVSLHENVKNFKVDGSNSQGKRFINLRELLDSERAEFEAGNTSPVIEKTVYVDTVQVVKSQGHTSPSDGKEPSHSEDYVFEIQATGKKVEEAILVDSPSLDIENIEHPEKKTISELEGLHFTDSPLLSASDRSNEDVDVDSIRHNQTLTQASRIKTSSKVSRDGKIDLESEALMRLGDQQNHSSAYSPLPLPPPLPKSPSDSWLSRTLSSASSKKPSSRSSPGVNVVNGNHASESAPVDPKWETIVKSSNVHHGHLRFSEELLPPIPET